MVKQKVFCEDCEFCPRGFWARLKDRCNKIVIVKRDTNKTTKKRIQNIWMWNANFDGQCKHYIEVDDE